MIVLCILIVVHCGTPALAQSDHLQVHFAPFSGSELVIDGVIEDEEWNKANSVSDFICRRGVMSKDTELRFMADQSHLYFAFVCRGSDAAPQNVSNKGRDELQRTDDTVGLFLDIDHAHTRSHLFLVGHNGQQVDAVKDNPKSGGWGDLKWNGQWQSAVHRAADHWSVELAIPVTAISGRRIEPGSTFGFNAFRTRPALLDTCRLTAGGGGGRTPWFADLICGGPGPALSGLNATVWRQGQQSVRLHVRNHAETARSIRLNIHTSGNGRTLHWPAQELVLMPREERAIEASGRIAGDQDNEFRISIGSRDGKTVRYSSSWRFDSRTGFADSSHQWTMEHDGRFCFPAAPFRLRCLPVDGSPRLSRDRIQGHVLDCNERAVDEATVTVAEYDDHTLITASTGRIPAGDYTLSLIISDSNQRHPRKFDFSTPGMRYNRAYWARIDEFDDSERMARIRVDYMANRIQVDTENIRKWTLLPDWQVFDRQHPISVEVDGMPTFSGHISDHDDVDFSRDPAGIWQSQIVTREE